MPRTNTNYNNNVIYKIVCNDLNIKDLYVGHTTNFIKRKSQHKDNCSNTKDKHYNMNVYKVIRDNGGWINWSMLEIEKYPCSDCNEARTRERYWVETLLPNLNKNIPNRTDKEYKAAHREEQIIYLNNYWVQNKDKFNIKLSCPCGGSYMDRTKNRHFKCIKHQKYISSTENKN